MTEAIKNRKNLIVLLAAFFAVYVFWGSTYLAIKLSIETLPPFLMAGTRFAVAGTILFIWARFTKDYERPKFKHWKTSAIVGTFLLLGGNGSVSEEKPEKPVRIRTAKVIRCSIAIQ